MSKRSVPLNIENCTGCSACFSVCPENAIKMLSNNEGFLYPQINAKKCTDCALCAKICPALGRNFSPEHFAEPQTFVAYAGDNIRRQSSSGGIFGALALSVLKRGGYVCGAAFNAKWYVKHLIIDNQKDLPKLQRSKYVQSEIGNIYKELKKLLIKDKKVLFAGTPCQVAGLYACLQKDYENLWTVDLICHGVPSPRVFAEYLTEITNGEKILSVNFRDKRLSWEQFCLTVKTNNSVYS
ncbi:MAG: Coenzyme F420 hydrogenase/dehydrogenase, beta subunit C-terminal domain, partial [Candidatus Margulisbacteria bacterium]|nr:Coenzyme F420 hydrogenase/dehydrogenase, beta subunit C-terminal domain [Candidatus Margulisiibacteriota bacterium]